MDHRRIETEIFEPSGEKPTEINAISGPPPPFVEAKGAEAVDDLAAHLVPWSGDGRPEQRT